MLIPAPNEALPTAAIARVGLNDAIGLAVREMERLGLAETHRVGALYAAPDLNTQGAAFAATVVPRTAGDRRENGATTKRFKVLIECDGSVSVCPFAKRCARACKVASRS